MNKDNLKTKYLSLIPKYERLSNNLRDALFGFLEKQKIEYVEIECRVKSFDSFYGKIERKNYKEPFNEIRDICGVRIIHYYESDIQLIDEIIRSEFNISETENKTDIMQPDQFGYRSRHYIVTIPKSWSNAPNYRGLEGLFVEIQVRTTLMHAWAFISHKLSYKKEEDIPNEFKRSLFRLSALVELADQQFDILRQQRKDYMASLFSEMSPPSQETFDFNASINIDSLTALINIMCPERTDSEDNLSNLVEELRENNIGLKDIYEGYKRAKKYLLDIEKEYFTCLGMKLVPGKFEWAPSGVIRGILDVTSKKYLEKRITKDEIPKKKAQVAKKWMKILDHAQQKTSEDVDKRRR